MARAHENEYTPDVVSIPGETLQEVLDDRGMTQAELADRTGRPKKMINEIVKGKAPITPDTALRLERVLGISAGFWNALESNYQEHLARKKEEGELSQNVGWLTRFPVSRMIKFGWIKKQPRKEAQVRELLDFFGVASPSQWDQIFAKPQAAFRHSPAFVSDPGALAAWLRQGERDAQMISVQPFRKATFLRCLKQARLLTREDPEVFEESLTESCADAGVAVTLVRELPGCRVNGATRWLTPSKALIQLCLRHKWSDIFWFTFFHEAGHVLLHGKRSVFIETGGYDTASPQEAEANRFARDFLIPEGEIQALTASGRITKSAVESLAKRLEIHPGIVVGRLHHEGVLEHSRFNDLRDRLTWVDDAE